MQMTKPITLTAAVLFLCLGGDRLHIFGIDGKPILCVQEEDLHTDLMPFNDETTHLLPGEGHAPGFSFLFASEKLQERFPTYYINPIEPHPPRIDALRGSVGFTTPEDRKRWGPAMRSRDVEDIWYRRGACPSPVVEPLEGTSYYRVQCGGNPSKSTWAMIWNRAPDPNNIMPPRNDIVLATCSYHTPVAGPFKTYHFRNCMRTVIIDEFIVDYEFQEQNAGLIESFDRYLTEKILEWRGNCGGIKT